MTDPMERREPPTQPARRSVRVRRLHKPADVRQELATVYRALRRREITVTEARVAGGLLRSCLSAMAAEERADPGDGPDWTIMAGALRAATEE